MKKTETEIERDRLLYEQKEIYEVFFTFFWRGNYSSDTRYFRASNSEEAIAAMDYFYEHDYERLDLLQSIKTKKAYVRKEVFSKKARVAQNFVPSYDEVLIPSDPPKGVSDWDAKRQIYLERKDKKRKQRLARGVDL